MVETEARRGIWSEVVRVRAARVVLGNKESQASFTKTLSRWTRVGLSPGELAPEQRNFQEGEIMNSGIEPSSLGGVQSLIVLVIRKSSQVEVAENNPRMMVSRSKERELLEEALLFSVLCRRIHVSAGELTPVG